MIHLVLPYPVSANRYWKAVTIPGRTMMAPSKEAKAYKAEVSKIARAAGLAAPMACRVEMWLRLYPARPQDWARRTRLDPTGWDDDVRCIDLGNAEKVLADALEGIVYDNDRRIWRQHKERMEPDAKGARVELAIRAMAPRAVPQAALLGEVYPTTKPDTDNVVKAVFDGMNGVVWRDDVQAVDLAVKKRYGATPGVFVRVSPCAGAAA